MKSAERSTRGPGLFGQAGCTVLREKNCLAPERRAATTIAGAAATQLDTLRRAKTQAREAEYPVTGIVLHPQDWEDIELLKATDLQYIFAQPQTSLVPVVWGMPISDSTRMTTGEFLVGAFSLGAELFTQGNATVEISRSHASFFIQNMVAILAEMRALLAIYRETAFITGPFTEASGS